MAKKLLIIEDENILRNMYLERFSKQDNIEVFSADSAEEGFAIAKKEKPDLILLDILLPKASGVEMLEKLRKDPKTTDAKVIAFSNYDDPETKKRAKELGAIDYLIKTNYTPSQITSIVEKLLNEKEKIWKEQLSKTRPPKQTRK
ncbi:MAG: response regulator [Candidatus Pacebacteria bacterium]|nr:response regulator [Candidatus Paceibacterota bacterium]